MLWKMGLRARWGVFICMICLLRRRRLGRLRRVLVLLGYGIGRWLLISPITQHCKDRKFRCSLLFATYIDTYMDCRWKASNQQPQMTFDSPPATASTLLPSPSPSLCNPNNLPATGNHSSPHLLLHSSSAPLRIAAKVCP